ncbi:hypothetical protein LTR29_017566, partial [Friedmanniomyces endolithicus]
QYIEQNAWAQSQRPLHNNLGTPNLTHTPDWVDRPGGNHGSSARNLIRNLSGGNGGLNHTRDQGPGHGHLPSRTGTPFATPLPQKRAGLPQLPAEHLSSSGTVAVGSDGVEVPSSGLAAPPTGEGGLGSARYHHDQQQLQQQQLGGGTALLVGKVRGGVNGHGGSSGGGGPGGSGGMEREVSAASLRNISGVSAVSGASTIDAPLLPAEMEDSGAVVEKEGEREWERERAAGGSGKSRMPGTSLLDERGALPLYERGGGFETNPLLYSQHQPHGRDDGGERPRDMQRGGEGGREMGFDDRRHAGFGRGQEAAFETAAAAAAGLPRTSLAPFGAGTG